MRRGFNTIELLVSMGIVAVVAIAVALFIYSGRDARSLNAAREDVLTQQKRIMEILQRDLNNAIKNTGFSGDRFPGISRYTGGSLPIAPPNPGTENDGLALIGHFLNEYRVPLQPITGSSSFQFNSDYWLTMDPQVSEEVRSTNFNVYRLIESHFKDRAAAIPNSRLAFVSNSTTTNVLEVIGYDPSSRIFQFIRRPQDHSAFSNRSFANFRLQDFTGLATSLGVLLRVEWVVESQKLIRRLRYNEHTPPFESQIMAENVSEFRIDYQFDNRRSAGSEVTLPEDEWLNHIRDPRYVSSGSTVSDGTTRSGSTISSGTCSGTRCCTSTLEGAGKCLAWSDLVAVRIRLTFGQEHPELSKAQLEFQDDFFSFNPQTQVLSMTWTQVLHPDSFTIKLRGQEAAGQDVSCTYSNANSRCNPECVHLFSGENSSRNPNHPNWEGYGRFVGRRDSQGQLMPPSAYCMCGTDPSTGTFVPPDTAQGFERVQYAVYTGSNDSAFDYQDMLPGGNWSAGGINPRNRRVLACIHHFNVCELTEWRNKHYQAYNFCFCSGTRLSPQGGGSPTNIRTVQRDNPEAVHSTNHLVSVIYHQSAITQWGQELNTAPRGTVSGGASWEDANMSCRVWSTCDIRVQEMYRARGLTITEPHFERYCGCLRAQESTFMGTINVIPDYSLRCNVNLDSSVADGIPPNRTVCDTTWGVNPATGARGMGPTPTDPANSGTAGYTRFGFQPGTTTPALVPNPANIPHRVYRVVSPEGVSPAEQNAHRQGLASAEEALFCQCVQNRYYELANRSRSVPATHGYQGLTNYWDFREAEPDGCGFPEGGGNFGRAYGVTGTHWLEIANPPHGPFAHIASTRLMTATAYYTDGTLDAEGQPVMKTITGPCDATTVMRSGTMACLSPTETIAARIRRSNPAATNEQILAEYDRAGIRNEFRPTEFCPPGQTCGACGDRSSFCSSNCGLWSNDEKNSATGITQSRRLITDGGVNHRDNPSNPSLVDVNLLPSACGGPAGGQGVGP